jgi:hypothetical protein
MRAGSVNTLISASGSPSTTIRSASLPADPKPPGRLERLPPKCRAKADGTAAAQKVRLVGDRDVVIDAPRHQAHYTAFVCLVPTVAACEAVGALGIAGLFEQLATGHGAATVISVVGQCQLLLALGIESANDRLRPWLKPQHGRNGAGTRR